MDLKTINFKIENEIAFIELNRPKQYNSLNQAMAEDLFQVSLECDDNPNIRSVLMSGVGDDAFCAGGDVNSFHKYGDKTASHLKEVTASLHGAISRRSRMNVPLVVAVTGVAAGAGFSFLAHPPKLVSTSGIGFFNQTGSALVFYSNLSSR